MLSTPAVISAHASSSLLRGTEKKYIPTESNCIIFQSILTHPKADGIFLPSQYWLWCPIIAPILGAQVGVGFYDIFLKKQESEKSPESLWVSPLCLHFFWMVDRN